MSVRLLVKFIVLLHLCVFFLNVETDPSLIIEYITTSLMSDICDFVVSKIFRVGGD